MTEVVVLPNEHELIAQAMVLTTGDLAKASRLDSVEHNAMSLRKVVQANPQIRIRYQVLLADKMQEMGLHIAERIIKMAEMQAMAFGGEYEFTDPESGEVEIRNHIADPKLAIDLSKEISRLIAEGKGTNVSTKAAILLTSKEDAIEILGKFLDN